MPAKKPIVLNDDGSWERLQAGDTLDAAVTEKDVVTKVAAATLIAGNVVYCSSATEVNKARANAVGTTKVLGFATTAINSAASGTIQTDGVIVLTTGQWDALAGTSGGLTFNTEYFLSEATAGLITSTAPVTGYVVPLGLALSTTELDITLGRAIKL